MRISLAMTMSLLVTGCPAGTGSCPELGYYRGLNVLDLSIDDDGTPYVTYALAESETFSGGGKGSEELLFCEKGGCADLVSTPLPPTNPRGAKFESSSKMACARENPCHSSRIVQAREASL